MAASLARQRDELRRAERLAAVGPDLGADHPRDPEPAERHRAQRRAARRGARAAAGAADARRAPLVAAISREVDRLNGVTEEYLRFARLPRPALGAPGPERGARRPARLPGGRACGRPGGGRGASSTPRCPPIRADEGQLRAVFLNLLRNSREAMPRGGRVTVRTRAGRGRGRGRGRRHRRGDPPGDLTRIFEPFYSTKERGTGLGLAFTRQVVEEHGGIDPLRERGRAAGRRSRPLAGRARGASGRRRWRRRARDEAPEARVRRKRRKLSAREGAALLRARGAARARRGTSAPAARGLGRGCTGRCCRTGCASLTAPRARAPLGDDRALRPRGLAPRDAPSGTASRTSSSTSSSAARSAWPDTVAMNAAVESAGGSLNGITARDHGCYYTPIHPDEVGTGPRGARRPHPAAAAQRDGRRARGHPRGDPRRGGRATAATSTPTTSRSGSSSAITRSPSRSPARRRSSGGCTTRDVRAHHQRFYIGVEPRPRRRGPGARRRGRGARGGAPRRAAARARSSEDLPPPPWPGGAAPRARRRTTTRRRSSRSRSPARPSATPTTPSTSASGASSTTGSRRACRSRSSSGAASPTRSTPGSTRSPTPGMTVVDGACAPEKLAARPRGGPARARRRSRRAPVPEEELLRVQRRHRMTLAFSLDSAAELAGWYGAGEVLSAPEGFEERCRRVEGGHARRTCSASRAETFRRRNLVAVVVGPARQRERAGASRSVIRGVRRRSSPTSTSERRAVDPPARARVHHAFVLANPLGSRS